MNHTEGVNRREREREGGLGLDTLPPVVYSCEAGKNICQFLALPESAWGKLVVDAAHIQAARRSIDPLGTSFLY